MKRDVVTRYVVEVNEAMVFATDRGTDWWVTFCWRTVAATASRR